MLYRLCLIIRPPEREIEKPDHDVLGRTPAGDSSLAVVEMLGKVEGPRIDSEGGIF
jgi:hypothetical protein